MRYREKGTVEAWQVPQEKDRRKTLPEWVADWHPGRVPGETALVVLADSPTGAPGTTRKPMAGDYLVKREDSVEVMSASDFTTKYEPAE